MFPGTRHQRCWQHKLVNVLNKVPMSVQPGMKSALREVRDAPDRATAEAASKTWRRLKGENRLPSVIEGVTFTNGVAVTTAADQRAA